MDSPETICQCYSQSEFIGFDETLKGCLTEFNATVNKKKKDVNKEDSVNFAENQLMILLKELIQTCPKYQMDFNNVLLNRYSNRNKDNLEMRMDSLQKVIDSADNKAGRYIQLSELEILNEEYDRANESVNTSIKMNPKMEMSYFVRGFLYHRKGQLTDAISDFKTMRNLTKQSQLKQIGDLYILNLEQELK